VLIKTEKKRKLTTFTKISIFSMNASSLLKLKITTKLYAKNMQ